MKTHICVGGVLLCGCRSVAAAVNSTECERCGRCLDGLLDTLLRAAVTGTEKDRNKAVAVAEKLGFDLAPYR